MFKIAEIDDVEMAFSGDVSNLMPAWEEIPEEFKYGQGKWSELASRWFFKGLRNATFKPKEGVNQSKALRHIKTVLGSFDPRHEHKIAGVAYLLSQWFEDVADE